MSDRPWFKFYPGDWRADEALRLCSLAARGLWLECMCVMHKAEPYGHLLVRGLSPSPSQLAALVGATPDQIEALLQELEWAGVFSRTREGVIYSRRMTADERKRRDGHASAEEGTLPDSRRGRRAVEKPSEKRPPPRVVGGVAERPPPMPPPDLEARGQRLEEDSETSSESCPKRKRVRTLYPEDFDRFWSAYPTDSLMSKKLAFDAFKRCCEEDRKAIIESVPAFTAYCNQHPDYRPVHACRYISQRRFEGFLGLQKRASGQVFVREGTPPFEAWQKRKPTPVTDSKEHGCRGWYFPSEWPPKIAIAV